MAMPDETTFVVVAGLTSPGICKFLSPPVRRYSFDEKKTRGRSGSWFKPTGEKATEVSIAFELYDEFDLDAWTVFAAVLDDSPKDQALDITHPTLADRKLTSVVVEEVGAPVAAFAGGPHVATVKLRKFTPKPPPVRVGRAKGSNDDKKKPRVEDELDKALRKKAEAFHSNLRLPRS